MTDRAQHDEGVREAFCGMSVAGLNRAATRSQLAEMRNRLIGKLGLRVEGGNLALLAATLQGMTDQQLVTIALGWFKGK